MRRGEQDSDSKEFIKHNKKIIGIKYQDIIFFNEKNQF